MRQLKNLLLIGSASAVLALTGCASWQGREGDRTAGRVVDDNRINEQVKTKLNHEPVYKFTDVDVRTYNGVVQLSGFVTTEEQKRMAGDLAQHVDGVAQVVNNITLKPQGNLAPTGRTTSSTYPNQPTPAPVTTTTNSNSTLTR